MEKWYKKPSGMENNHVLKYKQRRKEYFFPIPNWTAALLDIFGLSDKIALNICGGKLL